MEHMVPKDFACSQIIDTEAVPMPTVARQTHQRPLSLRVSTMACTLIRVSSRSFIVR